MDESDRSTTSSGSSLPRSKMRFDLFVIMEWTACIAVLCALVAGSGATGAWTIGFTKLPDDDSALLDWLQGQGLREVAVFREEKLVRVEWKSGILYSINRLVGGRPDVPWDELGYAGPTGMSASSGWDLVSDSPYLWLSGFAVLILLSQLVTLSNRMPASVLVHASRAWCSFSSALVALSAFLPLVD